MSTKNEISTGFERAQAALEATRSPVTIAEIIQQCDCILHPRSAANQVAFAPRAAEALKILITAIQTEQELTECDEERESWDEYLARICDCFKKP